MFIERWCRHAGLAAILFLLALLGGFARAAQAAQITLTPFSTPVNNPIGIDWHEPSGPLSGQLIMSVNYPTGLPNNLDRVDPVTGVPTQFSALAGLTEELKIATVRPGAFQGGFAAGELFTANGNPGHIVRISANGGSVLNPWVILPGETTLIRGSFFQDRFGVAGGDLIVVTGNDQDGDPANNNVGNVWRVTSAGVATKVATLNTHLEGVITLPNIPSLYGPAAGRILVGAEDLFDPFTYLNNGRLYAVNPNAVDDYFTIGSGPGVPGHQHFQTATPIHAEDLDLIRRQAQFFGVAFRDGQVLASELGAFDQFCGQVLVTTEFPSYAGSGTNSGLSVLRWDAGSNSFIVQLLTTNRDGVNGPQVQQWEHVTFTSGTDCLGHISITKNPKNATFNIGDQLSFTIVVKSDGVFAAQNVALTDPLPTTGGLTWAVTSVTPAKSCSINGSQILNCTLGTMNPLDTVTVVVTTNNANGAPAGACTGGKLNNIATASADGLPNVQDTGDYTCQPGSYTLTKNPKGASYNIGDNISFTMTVTSTGPGTANNVVLNDPLPTLGNLSTWIISSDPSGVCTILSNTLNCQYGNLANGQTRTVIVSTNAAGGANATACTEAGSRLDNTATLTGTGLPTLTDTGDYSCRTVRTVGSYTLVKTPKNATYNIGQNISFSMLIASTGPGSALNVKLNDPLPTLGNLNSWIITTNPGGCSITANTLNCSFGDLANGQTRLVTVATNAVGGANASACPGGQKLNNTALLTSDNLLPLTDTGDYTCTPPTPQLKVDKTPDGATFNQGDQISFSIVVSNTSPVGGVAATNVKLADTLPTAGGLSWFKVSTTQGSCTLSGANSNLLSCTLGTIQPQKSVTVTVTTKNNTLDAACTLQDNPAAIATADGGLTAQDSGFLLCSPPATGLRITGGGSIFAAQGDSLPVGTRVTHGLQLHCDTSQKNPNLEINWDGGNNFHLDQITSVTCYDDPLINPPPPPGTVIDTYAGTALFNGHTGYHGFGYATGTGTCNKLPAQIWFILTDAGEPGTADVAEYHITGGCTLNVGPALITKGNHQFHKN